MPGIALRALQGSPPPNLTMTIAYSNFTDEETEHQRDLVTFTWNIVKIELGFRPRRCHSEFLPMTTELPCSIRMVLSFFLIHFL